jgi:short-subunit dehydrogenase
MNNEVALITGATSGIGLHLSHQFASHGHPLVLVAPEAGELDTLAGDLKARYGIRTLCIALDLEDTDSAAHAMEAVEGTGWKVDILVNNAGHGYKGLFWELPIATHLSMLRLNVEAVLRMTAAFLPGMVERRRGRLLTTASIAGFEPGPTMAVYHASKAFVLSWSEALATELAGTGVTVTALCPGPTDTDFFPKGDMEQSVAFQKANLMDPEEVAVEGYKAAMEGERVVVVGGLNKAMVFSRRFMSESMQAKMNEKMYEDVDDGGRQRVRGDKETAPGSAASSTSTRP